MRAKMPPFLYARLGIKPGASAVELYVAHERAQQRGDRILYAAVNGWLSSHGMEYSLDTIMEGQSILMKGVSRG